MLKIKKRLEDGRRNSLDDDYEYSCAAIQKLPLKRFEIAIHKLTAVAIPLHLELLNQHQLNINKFQKLSEWSKLSKELVNSSRTVKQIQADIVEMDMIKSQIVENDQKEFDRKINEARLTTLTAVQNFIELHEEVTKPNISFQPNKKYKTPELSQDFGPSKEIVYDRLRQADSYDLEETNLELSNQNNGTSSDMQMQRSSEPHKLSYSWSNLKTSLVELNQLVRGFSTQVHQQKPIVDSVENNIEVANENVKSGTQSLSKAAKLKMAAVPVAGAVIGCCAGGPIGLYLGMKVGMAAAVGASFVGYHTGKLIKGKQNKMNDLEMSKMSMSHSSSLPEGFQQSK